jgi:SAM-dependent methyltransferase
MKTAAEDYVNKYYNSYRGGDLDTEMRVVASFLINNVQGKVLDAGCGPVPQLWALFMPDMTELSAIDLPQESISFVQKKISSVSKWKNEFLSYQRFTETLTSHLPEDYIEKQTKKISIQQADLTKKLPFIENYFDTVISLYSLGCLESEKGLQNAIENLHTALKPNGVFLHINTNGKNSNPFLPAYTWNGLDQTSLTIKKYLARVGFKNITIDEIPVDPQGGMYSYNLISLIKATK